MMRRLAGRIVLRRAAWPMMQMDRGTMMNAVRAGDQPAHDAVRASGGASR